MNSIKSILLLLAFLGLIPGCCPDVDPFYRPTEMTVSPIWNNMSYDDLETVIIEEAVGFELWIEFSKKEYLAQHSNPFTFTSRVMATQPCPEDGHEGLKSPVNSLTITSSADFQGIPTGESINDFFHRLEPSGADENGNQSFEQQSVDSELGRFHYLSHFEEYLPLHLTELPGNNLEHQFTVLLIFEDGTSLSGTSSEVQF
ncbi:MAG: hypothetical protein AB8B53_09360 [Flavobacteriales bacterium]